VRGDRFHGSTKRTDRREPQAVEKSEREPPDRGTDRENDHAGRGEDDIRPERDQFRRISHAAGIDPDLLANWRLRGADKKTYPTVGARLHYNLELWIDRSAGRVAAKDSCGPA
jgi:hypothetical protein